MNPLFRFINGGQLSADEKIERDAINSSPNQIINEAFTMVGLAMIQSMADKTLDHKMGLQTRASSRISIELYLRYGMALVSLLAMIGAGVYFMLYGHPTAGASIIGGVAVVVALFLNRSSDNTSTPPPAS